MSPIDEYLENLNPASRAALERVRAIARAVAPEAEDGWSYGIPTLKYRGKSLIGFASGRSFLSLYPYSGKVADTLATKLKGFDVSAGNGSIHFTAARPIPEEVLTEIVRLRLADIESRR